MPRKLRFFLTKNHERKRQQTVLQHSASHRPLPVMKVSIPISYFLLSPTKNVQELCQRIDVFNLPSEWKEHKELRQNCALLFTSTIVYSGTNLLALVVKINDSLNWSLSCNGTLRESKCITLPSQRTLRDYTHHIETKPGFSTKVDTEICRAAKIEQCIEREKFVILLLDEIHVKEDLVYNKHTGKLIGFSFLNEIWSDLDSLEEKVTESSFPPELLANSMMTFMVRGLFTHLEYPYVYFPTCNVTGSLLIDPLWETVDRLERHGFKV